MKVAATFIKHNVMTILLYLMVIVFGFYSFSTLPLALMPSMEVPAAIVYATYPGAGPEDIEQQVAKPLESVNVSALEKFEDGAVVDAKVLLDAGVLSKCTYGVKILGNGEITKKLTVKASAFSESAKAKIEAAGGKAEVV